MAIALPNIHSKTTRTVLIVIGAVLGVFIVLVISASLFFRHAQAVANKNMHYPCPRYLMGQHPTLQVGDNDATRPDKCVHYFQAVYNLDALAKAKKDNKQVVVLLTIDGVYSAATANAVKLFQTSNPPLKATGKVDGKTWYQLELAAHQVNQ